MTLNTASIAPSRAAPIDADMMRLISSPLGVAVFGVDHSADVYLRNGFRFLALPAWTDSSELEIACGRLRNRMKLGGEEVARGQSIQLGYDDVAPPNDVNDCIDQLRNPKRRLSHRKFVERFDPIIQAVLDLRDYLRQDVHLTDKMLKVAEFDRFCVAAVTCINGKVDYKSDDRERALLYGAIVCRRLLTLPVSGSVRLRLERLAKEHLYPEINFSRDFDACKCFFLPDQEADSSESLLLPIYKIAETRGASIRWTARSVLVPRSKLAAQYHRGKVKLHDLEQLAKEKNRPLYDEIQALGREEQHIVSTYASSVDIKLKKIAAHFSSLLQELNTQYSRDEKRAEEPVRKQTEAENLEIAKAERKLEVELDAVALQYQPEIEPLKKEWEARFGAHRGVARFFTVETFGAAAAGAAVAAMLHYVGFGVSNDLILGATVGILCRHYAVRSFRSRLTALEEEMQQKAGAARAAYTASVEEVRRNWAPRMESAKSWLKKLDEARYALDAKRRAAKDKASATANAAIVSAKASIEKRRRLLQNRFRASFNAKTPSQKTEFPPYSHYLSQGFRAGDKPSSDELRRLVEKEMEDFMDSLDPGERVMLQLAHRTLSGKEFSDFLGALQAMLPSERRARLRWSG